LRLVFLPSINDDGIKFLISMVNLTTLWVKRCMNITKAGIEVLRINHMNSWMNDLKIYYQAVNDVSIPGMDDDDLNPL
jgi:hypothetical protein